MKHRFHNGRGERDDVVRSVPNGWPPEAVPRWLSRECAAFYCGMSSTHFDALVRDGVLPQPRQLGRLTRYDRLELDATMAKIGRRDGDDDDLPEPKA
jgi:predicted DNA-binding transcriptional regulator AlpA